MQQNGAGYVYIRTDEDEHLGTMDEFIMESDVIQENAIYIVRLPR